MAGDGERLSNEDLARSYTDSITTDFEAEEVGGVDGDNTSAAAGAKSTADAIRSLMSGAANEVNLDAAAISSVAGDFAAWDELMSR